MPGIATAPSHEEAPLFADQVKAGKLAAVARLTALYALDKPVPVQYCSWIANIIFRGDFGRSFQWSKPVAEFVSPCTSRSRFDDFISAPPQPIRFYQPGKGFRGPFMYRFAQQRDPVTLRMYTVLNKEETYRVRFFVHGEPYRMWGLFRGDLHLFGVEGSVPFFLFGSDTMGRDVFSRIICGARIALSVGLVGVLLQGAQNYLAVAHHPWQLIPVAFVVVSTSDTLLEEKDLKAYFHLLEGTVRAVDGISFDVPAGSTVGIIGESGSGKSVTAQAILRIIPSPPGRIAGGQVLLHDGKPGVEPVDLAKLPADGEVLRGFRGNTISMIFQEPIASFGPLTTIGKQIAEALLTHDPHMGTKLAMALSCSPRLLIADEPTTAVDVTIQAQTLNLLKRMQDGVQLTYLFVSHDLGVVRYVSDRIAVMYVGKLVELSGKDECRQVEPKLRGVSYRTQ